MVCSEKGVGSDPGGDAVTCHAGAAPRLMDGFQGAAGVLLVYGQETASAYETAENRMKSYLTRIDEWLRTRLAVFVCHVFPKSNKSTCLNPQKIYKRIYSVEPKYLAVNDRLSRHVPWQNQRTLLR